MSKYFKSNIMLTKYFKLFGQKAPHGKMILIAVVDDDFLGDVPEQFECQSMLLPKTIYTGTYPEIKVNTDTISDVTREFKGKGIAGVIVENEWYCSTKEEIDHLGIALEH